MPLDGCLASPLAMVLAAMLLPVAQAVDADYDPNAAHALIKRKRVSVVDTVRWDWAAAFFFGVLGVFVVFIIIGVLLKLLNPPRAEPRHHAPLGAYSMRQNSAVPTHTPAYGPAQSQVALLDTQAHPYSVPSYTYSDGYASVAAPPIQPPAATYTYDDSAEQRMTFARGGHDYMPLRKMSPVGFNMSTNDLSQVTPPSDESPFEVYETNAFTPAAAYVPTSVASSQNYRYSRGPLPVPPKRNTSHGRQRDHNEAHGIAYSTYGAARPTRKSSQRSVHSAVSRTSSQLSRVDSIGAGDYRRNSRRRSQMTTAERLAALRAAATNNEESQRRSRRSKHYSYDDSTTGYVVDAYSQDYRPAYRSNGSRQYSTYQR